MTNIIFKDGQAYEVQESPISIEEEERKLSSLIGCLENDARELAEYHTKLAEIDALPIPDEFKQKLKESVVFYSPSGVKQEMVDEQRERVTLIKSYGNNL